MAPVVARHKIQVLGRLRIESRMNRGASRIGDRTRGQPGDLVRIVGVFDRQVLFSKIAVKFIQRVDDRRVALQRDFLA